MPAIAPVTSLVFIDAAVADYQSLIDGLVPGAEAIVLDLAQDGVEQITAALASRSNIQSVHIVSHGSSGSLQLGAATLNGESIDRYQTQLQGWRSALTEDADILLYGCDVAGDDSGEAFVRSLSQVTGADVAASTDLTGSAKLGGDWDLEVPTGAIESATAWQPCCLSFSLKALRTMLRVGRWAPNGKLDQRQLLAEVLEILTLQLTRPPRSITVWLELSLVGMLQRHYCTGSIT
jgi:hypothetical protein